MEMRAVEDIAIGEDLTPALPPLAFVLLETAVSSYCSACFSILPPQPFPPLNPNSRPNCSHFPSPTPLYCSVNCSSIDSPLHFSSGELRLLSLFRQSPPFAWEDSSDLRLSLRLIHLFQKIEKIECPEASEIIERIGGLMTNREKLIFEESENSENVYQKIRSGAKMMAEARRASTDHYVNAEKKRDDFVLEEMVLCLVLTNAVEVQDKNGCTIGIAVYDTAFSWINHSCSPNSCYRFVSRLENHQQSSLRIASYATSGCRHGYGDIERNGYGPRVIVRSIKAVQKGEEVTIAYTDLLQPKEMRRAQLWFKYRFSCSCPRCVVVPTTYVDYALQALSVGCTDNQDSSDSEIEKLMQSFDDATNDYLSLGDAESCCKKLEHLIDESIKPKETKSPQLHLFHYLSLNAYTTLASSYKVRASDLSALNYEVEKHKLEAFDLYKTSAAYSLLLAGVTHHLFMSESALVASGSNFWINAGESLLNLAKNSMRNSNSTLKPGKCSDYCLVDTLEPNSTMQLEEIKSRFFNCIANMTLKVWSVLASESSFLRSIQNPIDFTWLASSETSMILSAEEESRLAGFVLKKGSPSLEASECDDQVRMNLVMLSGHCLRYGAILSSICYGLSDEMAHKKSNIILAVKY
ncbi:hypothetical protein MIMGU_mgv1a023205mg [Erythranthe guttata]|uniref:SET domain-containing protein n=1 Tax=Erythranthe guttata TaxID=4155 RepID=A0A022RA10_ERYGU|nr:hypothetical protein MIMGU_mgv1a023205mg [Erythranthe guttata]